MIPIKCPYCFNLDSKVIDKRNSQDHNKIRRRRECIKCRKRWTTAELLAGLDVYVVKRDGKTEKFRREKLLNSIIRACNKRNVDIDAMEFVVDSVEKELRSNDMRQIHSSIIGTMVLNELRKLDKVSYLRFLGIHKNLDLDNLKKEMKKL